MFQKVKNLLPLQKAHHLTGIYTIMMAIPKRQMDGKRIPKVTGIILKTRITRQPTNGCKMLPGNGLI